MSGVWEAKAAIPYQLSGTTCPEISWAPVLCGPRNRLPKLAGKEKKKQEKLE